MIQLNEVKELLERADDETLTIYVTTDNALQENQSDHPAWHTFVKNALRDMDKTYGEGETGAWPDVRDRAKAFFDDFHPSGKGFAAIFTQSDLHTFELPFQIDAYAAFDKPNILPLLWVMDEYEPYVIVMVDHEKAYFLIAYLGVAQFQKAETLHIDFGAQIAGENATRVATQTGEKVTRGSVRDEYQDFIDEHVARLHRDVAEKAAELLKEHRARRLVLAGNEDAAHAVEKYFPESLSGKLVMVKAIPMRYTEPEILNEVQDSALEFERQEEMKLVQEVINLAKAGGRGALGWEAVREALEQKRVELLILPWPVPDEFASN